MKLLAALAMLASCALSQGVSGGSAFRVDFELSGIAGYVGVITPPNFGGLQAPTNAMVCAKSETVGPNFYATLTYQTDDGASHDATVRLDKNTPYIYACGFLATPGLVKVKGIFMVPYSKGVAADLTLAR